MQLLVCAGKLDLQVGAASEVMTPAELAEFLGLTMTSLMTNLWRYDVPHRRLGVRTIFSRALIHKWITGRIEERVWIDHYRNPHETADFWIRETIEPPPPKT